jgi:ATP-dependent DNA ligase
VESARVCGLGHSSRARGKASLGLATSCQPVAGSGGIVLSDHIEAEHGPAMFRAACAMGLDGIVSKRLDRPYRSGRSPDWIKVKNADAPAATRVIEH